MSTIKNIFMFLLILTMGIISSCDKNNTKPEGSACLLTRITKPGGETGGTISYIIEYNEQRKPIRYYEAENTGNYTSIEYTNNNLFKVTEYLDGVLNKTYTYQWYKDSIVVMIESFFKTSSLEKMVYTINSDQRLLKEQWYWQDSNGNWQKGNYYLYTWGNNNLVKVEHWLSDKVYTNTYEYDNRINAYESLGLFFDVQALSLNNVTKETIDYENGSAPDVIEYSYEYNENAYPYKKSIKYSNGTLEEISFEYNCN